MTTSLDHTLPDHAHDAGSRSLISARRTASFRRFLPIGTVRCHGRAAFRSQLARDLALLLDLDPDVASWRCLAAEIEGHDGDGELFHRIPDFLVENEDGSTVFLDADGLPDFRPIDPGIVYRSVPIGEIRAEPALTNARDMMRYAKRSVPLGDRIRLVAYLEEMSSVPLMEAASAMRESPEPIGAVMALALKRFVFVDWQDEIIGPETIVRLRP